MTKTRSVAKGPSGWMMRASGTLATLSLLAAGVPGCEGQNDPAQAITGSAQAGRESKVRMDMKSIADALSADFLMSQQWPSGDDAAAGPLQGKQDPWGEPYIYEPPASPGQKPLLMSKGPDRERDTDDDLVFDAWQNLGG